MRLADLLNEGLSLADSIEFIVDVKNEVAALEHLHVFAIVALPEVLLELTELRHGAQMEAALDHQLIRLYCGLQIGGCFGLGARIVPRFWLLPVYELFSEIVLV